MTKLNTKSSMLPIPAAAPAAPLDPETPSRGKNVSDLLESGQCLTFGSMSLVLLLLGGGQKAADVGLQACPNRPHQPTGVRLRDK